MVNTEILNGPHGDYLRRLVGARVVEQGGKGLYGRPRPAYAWLDLGLATSGDHKGPPHLASSALAPTDTAYVNAFGSLPEFTGVQPDLFLPPIRRFGCAR